MSSGLDFDVKERVKQATDIVDLIGSDLPLRRQGANFVAHCPWHDDSRPSLQVNPARQSWVCWPCGIRGDIFDFVMRRESVDFRESLVILAERAGIPITKLEKRATKGSAQDKQTLYRAMAWVEAAFNESLLTSEAAIPVRDYLTRRGVTDESIETFRMGFAPLAFSWLVDRARNTEFSPEILEACGLIYRNQRGGWTERFRGRLLFPIRDTQQRPVAFGGRVVPGIYGTENEPPNKYYNSSETRLFSKSNHLFGLNIFAKDRAARDRKLTIVEGYTDVVAAWQAGLRNVVAALGTAINEKHLRLIRRFADQVTLVLDGDEAGQKTANRVLDLFVAQDIDLRILSLPDGQDPFDYFQQHNGEAFQQLVANAPDAMAHKIKIETDGFDVIRDTHRASQALENILKTMASVPSKVFIESPAISLRQDQIVTRLSRQFQIERDTIRRRLSELRTNRRSTLRFQDNDDDPQAISLADMDRNEVELVETLLQQPELLDFAIEKIPPSDFGDGPLKSLYQQMEECFHNGQEANYDQLKLEIEDQTLSDLLNLLADEAIRKLEVLDNGEDSVATALQNQMESIVLAFQNRAADSGNRKAITRFEERSLDEKEEMTALEDLLKQTRQRQGL